MTYWGIEGKYEIGDFVGTVLRKDREADMTDDGWSSRDWPTDLLVRNWTLRIVDTYEVHGSDYLRSAELARRSAEMKRGIERYGHPIWPIVVRQEGKYLADWYCRCTTLKEIGVPPLYAYVGSKEGPDGP